MRLGSNSILSHHRPAQPRLTRTNIPAALTLEGGLRPVARTSSIKNQVMQGGVGSAASSVVSSPVVSAMGGVTPLPSPTPSRSPGSWPNWKTPTSEPRRPPSKSPTHLVNVPAARIPLELMLIVLTRPFMPSPPPESFFFLEPIVFIVVWGGAPGRLRSKMLICELLPAKKCVDSCDPESSKMIV